MYPRYLSMPPSTFPFSYILDITSYLILTSTVTLDTLFHQQLTIQYYIHPSTVLLPCPTLSFLFLDTHPNSYTNWLHLWQFLLKIGRALMVPDLHYRRKQQLHNKSLVLEMSVNVILYNYPRTELMKTTAANSGMMWGMQTIVPPIVWSKS